MRKDVSDNATFFYIRLEVSGIYCNFVVVSNVFILKSQHNHE